MNVNRTYFDDIEKFNFAVERLCAKSLTNDFNFTDIYNILTGKSEHTEEQLYYAYFWYCWKLLYISYLTRGGDNFGSLPYTRKVLDRDNINFNTDFLENFHTRVLFYIACALIEFLDSAPSLFAIQNDERTWPLISKVEGLVGEIDGIIINQKYKQLHTMALLPYLVRAGTEKVNTQEIERTVIKAQESFNRIVNDPRWEDMNSFLNANESIQDRLTRQNDLLTIIDGYDQRLRDIRNEYNFTNLTKAFSNIRSSKKKELLNSNRLFYSAALCVLLTPVMLLIFHTTGVVQKFEGWSKLFYIMPVATFELLLIYFTRLFYSNKKSVMAQLIQIDFRLSICEFVQSYIEERKFKKEDEKTWELFDSLVFSPIQLNEDKIPSLLDGADSIAEFINKAVKDNK